MDLEDAGTTGASPKRQSWVPLLAANGVLVTNACKLAAMSSGRLQTKKLRPNNAAMLMRIVLIIVIAVSGLLLAISSVAAMDVFARTHCAEVPATPMQSGHAMGHLAATHGEPATTAFAPQTHLGHGGSAHDSLYSCCDHGCLPDAMALADMPVSEARVTQLQVRWNDSDHVDLTGPLGLRRPPRA